MIPRPSVFTVVRTVVRRIDARTRVLEVVHSLDEDDVPSLEEVEEI